ncbi:bifunctional glycosyltransferase family 2 protein/CDP-glycerol:glycerophosphate glycerophosphotransferase [Streptomyces sp. NPDC093252]|uniref:bifunctional glycosyltransferase/CDP-glycerol:glycerophosphate glycerophosphotransferase n=1 Tax=Streptomyces sp. NPDC093252 TaxID=3154980 RepID=UPI00343DA3C4
MPRFTVIVPAYQVQAYLHECLESVLSQSYADVEVIGVDDGSPDACGEILDDFAARDPRVRAVRLPQHTGRARAAALERATGDYVLFLDGTDTLTPHALRTIADRLKETGEPDLLVHGRARLDRTGTPVPEPSPPDLGEHGPVPFAPADRPGLLTTPARSRAYRREFLDRRAAHLPADQPYVWSYGTLLAAEQLATLDQICVHERRPHGTASPDETNIFDQYDQIFALLEQRPGLAATWHPVLYRRMLDHLAARSARLPRRAHADFLRRTRDCCRRHRATGVRAALRHTPLRLGMHRTLRALRLITTGARRTARLTARLSRALRTGALRLHYGLQRRLPLREDRAVFTARAGHGSGPGVLEAAFRALAPHLRTAWIARPEQQHTVPPGPRRLVPDTAAYWSALARSKYLITDTDLDHRLIKRSGQIVVQTGRGTPLGHLGLDLLDRPAAAPGTDLGRLLRAVDQWDYVLSGNRHTTLTCERVLPGRYRTLEYGRPGNDVFQRATSADVARLRESLGVPAGAVALLYVPAHRDYRRTQPARLDLERVLRRLGPRFVLLARTPHTRPGDRLPERSIERSIERLIDVGDHANIRSLCLASDALITDYAPLMFDYAGLDRPIVLHMDDWAAYDAARGTYLDPRACPPGAIARDEDGLIDIFASGHWCGSRSAQVRAAFRARFCPHDDGRAAERVVRHVVLGQTGETAGWPVVVPPQDRHPVPAAASLVRPPQATVDHTKGTRTAPPGAANDHH